MTPSHPGAVVPGRALFSIRYFPALGASSEWRVASGQWSVVSGQWSVVNVRKIGTIEERHGIAAPLLNTDMSGHARLYARRSAPEGRKRVAHGATVGMGGAKRSAPEGR